MSGESDPVAGPKVARDLARLDAPEDADAYAAYIEHTGMHRLPANTGNRGAWMLRRDDGDRRPSSSRSASGTRRIDRGFAGDDIDVAVLYPEDDRFLVDRELTVRHYTIDPAPPA